MVWRTLGAATPVTDEGRPVNSISFFLEAGEVRISGTGPDRMLALDTRFQIIPVPGEGDFWSGESSELDMTVNVDSPERWSASITSVLATEQEDFNEVFNVAVNEALVQIAKGLPKPPAKKKKANHY